MMAKRKALWQILAAQLLLVAVPLYGLAPELSALASSRSDWEPKTRLRVSSSAREDQPQAIERFHPEIASGDSFHAEGIGTIRALTDETGAVSDRYTFEAFGTLLDHLGDDPNAYLFAGEPLDPNSGFYYNRARWLGPSGIFVSADAALGTENDPRSLHRYTYAGASPADFWDPSGRDFTLSAQAVQLAVRSALSSIVYNAIFRTFESILKISRGAEVGAAIYEGAIGALTDTVLDLVIPGVGSRAARFLRLRSVGQGIGRALTSVWNLPPFLRGREGEKRILNGLAHWSRHTIDYFAHGVAVSVKSIDLTARTYQSATALAGRLRGYAAKLGQYAGDISGVPPVFEDQIQRRVLVVAIEDGAGTVTQAAVLRDFVDQAWNQWKVIVKIVPIE